MAYLQEQVKVLNLTRELLSLRVEQLEFENKALHRVVMLQAKEKKLEQLIGEILSSNPGMRFNSDFELVPEETK